MGKDSTKQIGLYTPALQFFNVQMACYEPLLDIFEVYRGTFLNMPVMIVVPDIFWPALGLKSWVQFSGVMQEGENRQP